MKDFFRKNGKKLIAVLCSLTLVISCFQGIGSLMPEVNASDNTYTELTFSDFGIADQSFNSTTAGVAGKPSTDIKSLDKTIITGKITLSSHSDEHILIGGAEGASDYYASSPGIIISQSEGGQLLIRAQYDGNKGTDTILFNEEAPVSKGFNMLGDTITFRIQLDYVDEDVVVTMTMDNGTVSVIDSATLAGIASKMTTNMAFNPWLSSCSIASVVNYTEVTFSDFGIDNQSFTSTTTGVKGTLPSTKTSWNKTIFTGKLQVTKNIGTHFIFGGSNTAGDYNADTQGLILEYRTDGQLLLRWQNSSSSKGAEHLLFDDNLLTSQGFNMLEDELVFRIQFDYFGDDVTVTVTLDNGEVSATDKATFTGIASSMTTNMVFNPWVSDCSIASVVNYMEVTFSDFGIDNQSFTGTTTGVKGTLPTTKTSWNKTIFTGKLQVTKHIGTHFIFGGSNTAGDYNADTQGLILEYRTDGQLLLRWQNSSSSKGAEHLLFDDNLLTSQGFNMLEDELVFRIQFDYFGEDVTVSVTLDNGEVSATDKATFTGIASSMTTNMVFNPWVSDCKIGSVNTSEDPEEPVVEQTLTFSDFGIADTTYGGGNYTKLLGTAPAEVTTLDKVTFVGKVTFTNYIDSSLHFGGKFENNTFLDDYYGVGFYYAGSALWLRYRWNANTSSEILLFSADELTEKGINFIGDELIWRVRFDYIDSDVKVTLTLQKGEQNITKECTLSGVKDNMTTNMAFSPYGCSGKIESHIEYTDINFASFGISSQVVGAGQKASGSLAGGETLHGKHFTGRYRFSTGGDGYLGFGGSTSQNDSQGISLWTDGNGGLWARCWAGATKISGDGVQITKATLSESGIDLSDTVIVECWIEYVNNDNINVTWKLSDTEGDSYEKELSYSYTGITGMLSTTLIVASSAGTNSEIEPAEPTTYTDIDFASFNIPSQVVGAGQTVYGGLANDETLHGKHFTGRYRFSTGADGYIGFGGSTLTLDSQGISLWTDGNGGLLARCWVATKKIYDGEAISKVVLSENGIDLSKEVTVELWIEYKDTNNVNVTWKLSDEDGDSYEKDFSYTYEGITDLLSTYLIVTSSATADSEIEPEQPVAEGETIVTFYDFDYIEDMTMSAGTENAAEHIKGQANCIESFDNVTFKGTVSYETNATLSIPVLLFGGEKDSEQWTNINGAEKGFYLQLYDNGYVKMGVQRGTVNSVYTIGTAFTSGTSIDLQINFAYDEDDLRVTVYLTQGDTTIEHTARFKGAAAAIGTSTWLVAAPYGAKMTIASAYTRDVTKSDDAYMLDLKNPKAYLLTGKEITVNGISKTAGDTLSESGEYTIVYMKNGVKYTQKVSIFALGDLDTNASIIDGNLKDVVDSKTLVKIKKYVKDGTPTSSTQRAADLTNDEVVDDADAVFLRKVLVGLMELDEYYPVSLSYEFIGGSDVMPIGGYYGPYAKDGYDYITGDVYKTMQDANINLVVSSPMDYLDGAESNQNLRKALALGEKYKIGMYVLDSRLNQIVPTGNTLTNTNSGEGYGDTYAEMERVSYVKTAQEAANYFTNYSYFDSYLGNFAKDEPCTDTFPATGIAPINTGNHIDWYGDVASILNNYSNSFGYMNAQCYSGRCKEKNVNLGTYYENTSVELYTEYLNEMLTKSQIPMLSFDNYMYADGVDGEKRTVANTNTWLVNLDTVRTVAKSNETGREVPFWTYVAAGGYFDGSTETIENTDDIMTQAQFNWQVNVPLAFGTKGLTYFPLIQPSDFANADDKDNNLTRNGMINTEYETTKWYTYAQAINKQVTAIDHVLMKADSKGVIISEGTTSNAYKNMVNISYKRYGTSYYREYSVQNYTLEAYKESDPQGRVTKFTSSDTTNGAIAGVFSYQGKTAYYVVNWSDANTNNVTLTFDKASNYTVIQNAEESTGSGDTCQLSLAAGEGVLVVLNN